MEEGWAWVVEAVDGYVEEEGKSVSLPEMRSFPQVWKGAAPADKTSSKTAEGRMQRQEGWNGGLAQLKEAIGERNYETWIKPTRLIEEQGVYRLEVPNRFFHDWVTRHFFHAIVSALRRPGEADPVIQVVVNPARAQESGAAVPSEEATRPSPARPVERPRNPVVGNLITDYTFDRFVVGASNDVAYQAAKAVASRGGATRFNPLFLWGSVGVGKTHLVNAIGHELLRQSRSCRIGCLSAETFTNQMIQALKSERMAEFRDRFRRLDALILDDVQFLAGKDRMQEEFFHTFEALYHAGRQVVLTSDEPPKNIARLEERLRSRFEGGLIASMGLPTPEMRVEILRNKAHARGSSLPDEVLEAISIRAGASVRELEGALNRVLAFASFTNSPIDPALVDRVLGPADQVLTKRRPDIPTIQRRVAAQFGIAVEDLCSQRRDRTASKARQVAMFLARSVAGASLNAIAQEFGGRDHTSVLYAIRCAEQRLQEDAALARIVQELRAELMASSIAYRPGRA